MFASLNNRLPHSQSLTPPSQVFPAPPYGATGIEVTVGSASYLLSGVKLCADFIDGFCQANKAQTLIPYTAVLTIEYLVAPNASRAWVQTSAVTLQSRLDTLKATAVRVKSGPSNTWVKGILAEASAGWVRLGVANQRWLALNSIEAIQVLPHPSAVNN